MRCICKYCMHKKDHEEGLMCEKKMVFVHPHDGCNDFDTKEELNAWDNYIFYLALAAIGVVVLLNIFAR